MSFAPRLAGSVLLVDSGAKLLYGIDGMSAINRRYAEARDVVMSTKLPAPGLSAAVDRRPSSSRSWPSPRRRSSRCS